MKHTSYLPVALSICLCCIGCTMEKSYQGSISKLDGGFWSFYSSDPKAQVRDVWKVEDGVLVCSGSPLGYLYSNEEFDNFVLKLEWRWPTDKAPGKGGVLIHTTGENKIWPKGLEAQLNAGDAGDFWGLDGYELSGPADRTRSFDNEKFGKLTNVKKTQALEKSLGQWNTYEIISEGDTVTLIVNGTEANKATGCAPNKGKICLTSEGSEIYFRNVEISGESVAESAKPSNGLIAFADAPDQRAGPQATQYAQIYTITPDGRNRKQLTMGEPGNFFPAWSPSGEQLAFVSTRNQKHEIWVIDSTGKNERFITSGFLPAWSPDGMQLAITRPHANGRRRIWIIGIDGRGAKQLTSEGFNHCPTWSPKGDKIAYWSRDEHGFGQVWVMRSDGTQRRQLTRPQKNEYTPDGSSANAPAWLFSEQIAYWAGIEHRYGQVWTMNPDGSNQKQLTDEPAPASSDNPTWSPDGKKILFDTQRRKRPEIWVMNSDGSDERVLVSDVKVIPMRTSWQPVFSVESSNKTDSR